MAFSAEKDFEIESNKINYLSVEVPMVNIGVSLKLPEGFSDQALRIIILPYNSETDP